MMFKEVAEKLVELLSTYTAIPIFVGANPPMGSIGIDAEANTTAISFGNGRLYEMFVLINGKGGDQESVYEALCDIHDGLNSQFHLATGDAWEIYACETVASPHLLGRENSDNEQYLYGSSVRLKIYEEIKNESVNSVRR